MFARKDRYCDAVLYILIALSLCNLVYFFTSSLDNVVFDKHAFRQSQTAISAYWLMHGGDWLRYETPVLGAPWSIPFEFPVYQGIVALFARMGIPLNAAGRTISFLFFLATLIPFHFIFRKLSIGPRSFLIFSIIFLSSPLYVFWSRSFMMESTALFFSAAWIAMLLYIEKPQDFGKILICVIMGTLAALTKSTTFLVWGLAGFLLCLFLLYRQRTSSALVPLTITYLIAGLVPLAIGYGWVAYSDAVKSENPIAAAYLMSGSLKGWNFGTFSQRISEGLWLGVVVKRMFVDLFGIVGISALLSLFLVVARPKFFYLVVLLMLVFVSSFMIFTNLYFVHDYYLYASGIFAVLAVTVSISVAYGTRTKIIATIAVAVISISQIYYALTNDMFIQAAHDHPDMAQYQAGQFASKITHPDDAIVVFGQDWSSEVPYYAGRRGIAVPDWLPKEQVDAIFENPTKIFGDKQLGAIIDCRWSQEQSASPKADDWFAAHEAAGVFDFCKVYRPENIPIPTG